MSTTVEEQTVPEAPPEHGSARPSRWAAIFEEGRSNPGQWRRVLHPMKKSTCQQIASDIRNSYKRTETQRVTGINPKEQWEAEWGEKNDEYYVWIRYSN